MGSYADLNASAMFEDPMPSIIGFQGLDLVHYQIDMIDELGCIITNDTTGS
jgi:hypothetical protein